SPPRRPPARARRLLRPRPTPPRRRRAPLPPPRRVRRRRAAPAPTRSSPLPSRRLRTRLPPRPRGPAPRCRPRRPKRPTPTARPSPRARTTAPEARRSTVTGRLLGALLAAAAALPAVLVAGAQPSADVPANGQVAALVAAGEESYAWNCAVCHGAGGGIEEARLRFPPDERRCTRCHRPANRAVQPLDRPVVDNDMFS